MHAELQQIPLARASMIIEVARVLEDRGGSAERILARAHLPSWHYEAPDALIPTRDIWRFTELAAHAVGTPAFGHLIGARDPMRILGTLGTRLQQSPILYDALQTCGTQLHRHTSNVRCRVVEARDHVWFCMGWFTFADVGLAEMEQCILMLMVRIVRLAAGPRWRPAEVRLHAAPLPNITQTELLADAAIRYRQGVTAIAVPRALLPLPLDHRRPAASPPADGAGEAPALDFPGSVRQLIGTLLHQGYPKVEDVAAIGGVHVRTLQRRLACTGVTYKQLVDQARFEAARRSLTSADASVTEIAYDLSYTDVAHFSRAFRRWAGVSPRTYRRLAATP